MSTPTSISPQNTCWCSACLLVAPRDEVISRVERTIASLKDAERELARFKSADLLSNAGSLMGEGVEVAGIRLWTFQAPDGVGARAYANWPSTRSLGSPRISPACMSVRCCRRHHGDRGRLHSGGGRQGSEQVR